MKQKLTLLILLFFSFSVAVHAQNITINGVVTATEDGSPVIGAAVVVKGTSIGTNTDNDGRYSLTVPVNSTIVVSYLGLRTVEFTATQAVNNVALEVDAGLLDEVIVVAYGTATRASFTGSASTLSAKQIENRTVSNLTATLEGNAPGVQMTSALGQPGSSASIRIRGFGSYGASNDPLYVVDGAIYNGDINAINPADIESMTILKDAQSTALYGSSAGNGVILITTKKGTSTKGSVSLQISQGMSYMAYDDYARVNIYDYYPLQWEMYKNARITAGDTPEAAAQRATNNIAGTLRYNPFKGIANNEIVGTDGKLNPNAKELKWGDDLDWYDEAYKYGHRQEYNMSYNSRTDNSDSYASIGYLNESGYMLKTDFERFTGRAVYNLTPLKWMKTGINLGFTRTISNYSTSDSDSNSSYGNLTRYIRTMAPIYPIHKHDLVTGDYVDQYGNPTKDPKEYVYDYEGTRLSNNGRDAVVETKWNERINKTNQVSARTYLTIMPLEGLDVTANYSIDSRDFRGSVYENPYVGDGTAGPGRLYKQSTRRTSETFSQIVNYKNTFGKHNLAATAGHESYRLVYENFYARKLGQAVSGVYDFPNFTSIATLYSYTDTYTKEGYLLRVNYDYDNKYYLSASYRRDASSRFAKDNRWGNFWSFGGSWRVSQEEFMKNVNWVNNLKIRASYGETGVDMGIGYYAYQDLYNLGVTNSTEAGIFYNTLANPDLKWETQVATDVALEFGLFNKLTGTIEYFNKASRDLIFSVSTATSNGVASQARNIGKMKNEGLEFSFDYNIYNRNKWRVNFGFNITYVKNQFTKLPDENKDGIVSGSKKYIEGGSLYQFWLLQWYGVNPENGDGLYYMNTDVYKPENYDNWTNAQKNSHVEIDGKHLTTNYNYAKYDYSGNSTPDVYGGFNFRVGYGNFDLAATFSYQLGGQVLDLMYANMMSMSNYGYSMHTDTKKAWRQTGDVTDIPRLSANSTYATSIGQSYSTRWLVSSDYLNLRSVSLSYNIPQNFLRKMMISSARVVFTAENLFMLKARQGLNPMANFSGISYNEYLPARILSLALNLTF